jgi:putative membrane protein
MDAPTETGRRADLRDYLEAERTFLAWVRTGLALMGFGFVVVRFGLFLQQLRLINQAPSTPSYGLSLWFGTALIAVGVVVNLSSAWRHVRLVRELDQGETVCSRSLTQAVVTALFLALVGLAMGIYLVSVRASANLYSENYEEVTMASGSSREALAGGKGIIDKLSNHSVNQTVEKLKNILQSKGVTLFALVNHSGEAEKVGMRMRPTKLMIFGSPKAGTPLMLAAPSSAIDLPLKILIWADGRGKSGFRTIAPIT